MISKNINILLADDDKDDCMLFKEALEELELPTKLTTVSDGEQLMKLLNHNEEHFFNVLFLDLNMPRKNGFICLEEIKCNAKLKSLPVIIFSTSYDVAIADKLYKNGALHYICKPVDFLHLKNTIRQAITFIINNKDKFSEASQTPNDNYLISQ